MQPMKETASSIAASAKSGMEKTKATVQEKAEKMMTRDPVQKEMASQKKEDRINQAELEKREAREHFPTARVGMGTTTYSTSGIPGQPTGTHQMSAMPGHGTGQPAGGHVTEGTVGSHPIGRATGTGRTTAHNTHVGGGAAGAPGYGTGGGYSG